MSLYAILEALRATVRTIDPVIKTLILARRDEVAAGELTPVSPTTLLAQTDIDIAAEPDDLSMAPIVEELERYANPVKPRVYLCHPFSAPTKEERDANIQNTLAWLQWFVDNTTWAVGAPWISYVLALSEATYRERGIEDDKALIEGHTLLVCVTTEMTSGMRAEYGHARSRGIGAIDFTCIPGMTFAPPELGSDLAKTLRRVIEAVAPGTVRPVDFAGRPIPQGVRPRVDGCTSNECSIRNACTGSAACPAPV